jgi:ribonuclease P protein component
MTGREHRATFPREVRIRRHSEFQRVFDRKLRVSDRWITLYGCRGEVPEKSPETLESHRRGRSSICKAGATRVSGGTLHARLGIVAGRSVGNAVRRNRRKRLVREAFRHLRHELPAGTDWIVVLRAGPEPTVEQLQDSIRRLGRQLLGKMGN